MKVFLVPKTVYPKIKILGKITADERWAINRAAVVIRNSQSLWKYI